MIETIERGEAVREAAEPQMPKEPWILATIEMFINWGRKNSLWPLPFGTACCAIEFMSLMTSRYDFSRYGAEAMRFSPRQSDLLMVLGTVTNKQAPVLRKIFAQMSEPKWVLSVGACACSGGIYRSYANLQGIDRLIPVDIYVPGCPPRPEAIIKGATELQAKMMKQGFKARAADLEAFYKSMDVQLELEAKGLSGQSAVQQMLRDAAAEGRQRIW